MKTTQRSAALVLAVGAIAVVDTAQVQCSTYSVTVLPQPSCGILGPAGMTAHGINSAGKVCGGRDGCDGLPDPFYWLGGLSIDPISLPATTPDGSGVAINSSNQIVGTMQNYDAGGPIRSFFFSSGQLIDIGALPGDTFCQANDIDDQGRVCGYSSNPATGTPWAAVVWHQGVMTPLRLPFGKHSIAYGLSNAGWVCGWMGELPSAAHAFLRWPNGDVTDLGTPLPGSVATEARAVNNFGKACGNALFLEPAPFARRAFVWSNGSMHNLGVLKPYIHSFAWDINDSGYVIGQCTDQHLSGEPFIWREGGEMVALNDLIPASEGITMLRALSINNAGQIAGDARNKDNDLVAVILTPVPDMPGDFNCDKLVNVSDLLAVINHWGYTTPNLDFNSDGSVNVPDLMIVLDNWTF